MAGSANRTSPSSTGARRIAILAAVIVAGGLAWTAVWHYLGGRIEEAAADIARQAEERGRTVECRSPEARGYPFRFGLFCDAARFADPARGISATAGALRSAAQVYQPNRIVAELDGPLAASVQGFLVNGNWASLRASTVLRGDGSPSRLSSEMKDASFTLDEAPVPLAVALPFRLSLSSGEAHVRDEQGGLDAALYLRGAQSPAVPEAFDMTVEASLPRQAPVLAGAPLSLPLDATLHRVDIVAAGGGSIALNGSVNAGEDGLLNGTLTAELTDPEALQALAQRIDPSLGETFRGIMPVLNAMASAGSGGERRVSVPLTIRNGVVTAGFFPVAKLPPLVLE